MTILSSQEVCVFYANQFLFGLADVPQSCQQNLPYFLPCMKRFSTLAIYGGKVYSIRDK